MAQSDILDFVKQRNPNEPEFLQAAEEVIASVLPVLDKNPDYKKLKLLERMLEPEPLPADANAMAKMKHRLQTAEGRALYARRKCTVEPVFGIIKAVMGFRQFLLRGVASVRGEWNLVCMAWNLKRLHTLRA